MTEPMQDFRTGLRAIIWASSAHAEAKLILLHLSETADDTATTWATDEELAASIGYPTQTTRRIMSKMIHRGDLRRLRRFGSRNEYQLSPRR